MGTDDTSQGDDETLVFQRDRAPSSANVTVSPASAPFPLPPPQAALPLPLPPPQASVLLARPPPPPSARPPPLPSNRPPLPSAHATQRTLPPDSCEPFLQPPLSPGSRVGRFRVKDLIGRGGMGIVYRAEDETLRREVALKVLPPFHIDDVERRRLLMNEARAAAAVNHPNIATIHEVGEAEGRIYLAMEFIQGHTLRQRLDASRLPVEEVVGIARQIARGMQKAHNAGLVHRDLKPDNIMITDDGLAKVLDFGLAKQREQAAADADPDAVATLHDNPVTATLAGTPRYMCPEQVWGLAVDQRSDIFSFGIMLYEMLAGVCPFSGQAVIDLFASILYAQPAPLTRVNPDVTPTLEQVVMRCLAKAPEARYQDCASLLKDIDKLFPAARTFSASRAASAKSGAPRRDGKRVSILVGLGFAAGLASVIGIGALVVASRRPPPTAAVTAAPGQPPTPITDLPLPSSPSPEAIVAYKAAMQSLRDGDWGRATENLKRAVVLDPLMAAAHLRLALSYEQVSATTDSRASYARALQSRGSLSERDQVLLNALEPLFGRSRPDAPLAVQRLQKATERYPADAELFLLLAYFENGDRDASIRAAKRASEIDPRYADAWQLLGLQLSSADRAEEALAAFDRCVANAPASVDCRGSRAEEYRRLGRCSEMEEDLRSAITANSKAAWLWYEKWVIALYALGRPREAVLQAMEQKWAQFPEDKRRPIELLDRAQLDFEAGQFSRAETRLREGSALIQSDRNAAIHGQFAKLFVQIYSESGQPDDAADVADGYLKRSAVWDPSEDAQNTTMAMLRVALHTGKISKDAFQRARGEWLAQVPPTLGKEPGFRWELAYVAGIERQEEAEEAIAALSKLPPGSPSRATLHERSASIGKMYLLAGRIGEALPFLRAENQPCTGPSEGFSTSLALGQALERQGNTDGACTAYQVVLDHWGNAKPRSVTAKRAQARVKALDCASRKP